MDAVVTPPSPVVRLTGGGPAVAHYPPGATFGPRTLRDFEFVWLLTGHAHWHGPQRLDLRPGQLLLARPGMRDEFRWAARRTTTHAYVHFDLLESGRLGAPEGWPIYREVLARSVSDALCRQLLNLGRSPTPDALARVSEVLSWLLTTFVDEPVSSSAQEQDELGEHLGRLSARLGQDWARHGVRTPAVQDLARLVGLSGGHLSRLFRQRFGRGPAAALELVRLARGATLVQRSNLTIGTIATECGFASPFHFSRRFARVYGMPPRDYRQRPEADPLAPVIGAGLLPFAHHLLFDDG